MNNLQTFNFNGLPLRTQLVDGEPWLLAKDVADSLGYQNGSRDINRHVDPEDKISLDVFDGNQRREMTFINESGMFSLALSSKLPAAKKFKRWVTQEVLPTIRRTGGYEGPVNNTKLLLQASLEHEEKLEELSEDVGMLKETMRIDGAQEFQIKSVGNKKVIQCLGGYDSPAYKELAKKVYARFWRDFKKYFMIPRYGDLPKSKFNEALEFIDEWAPETEMRLTIKSTNNQTHLQLVNEKGD